MTDVLDLVAHLPEVTLQPGDVLVAEGTVNSSIWVVLGGRVSVAKQGVVLATLDTPGTIIGEVSVLLQTASTATVTAADRTTARFAADGAALLLERPQLLRHVATGLARRLDAMTTYLVDLEAQYGDAPGLAMIPDVVARLAASPGVAYEAGSAREPDPLY